MVSHQASLIGNGNVSRADALDDFKTFSGFILVLVAMMTVNKLGNNFMERDTTGLVIGSFSMALLNMIAPGPVGHVAAKGIEKLLSMDSTAVGRTLHKIGDGLYRWLACGDNQEGAGVLESGRVESLDLESGRLESLPLDRRSAWEK